MVKYTNCNIVVNDTIERNEDELNMTVYILMIEFKIKLKKSLNFIEL